MDEIFCLSNDWKEIGDSAELIPFGMGRIGRRVISSLMNEFDIPFLIDNREKQDLKRNLLLRQSLLSGNPPRPDYQKQRRKRSQV